MFNRNYKKCMLNSIVWKAMNGRYYIYIPPSWVIWTLIYSAVNPIKYNKTIKLKLKFAFNAIFSNYYFSSLHFLETIKLIEINEVKFIICITSIVPLHLMLYFQNITQNDLIQSLETNKLILRLAFNFIFSINII